jgi:N-acetylglucosamine-6-phosphate deacetylase
MGYCDLQINGYFGVDFNLEGLTAEGLHTACVQLQEGGVSQILATFITDHVPVMAARISRLVELREADELARQIIVGLHIEGPFISPVDGYRGAHPADAVIPASVSQAERLLDAGQGLVRLFTLAPEGDPGFATTRHLVEKGVKVAAGHTNASLNELRGAIDAGLTLFTHLGNGCPMQMHRHDNIIQRALSLSDELWCCFIADGVHIPFPTLRNYLRVTGLERAVVVTDAVSPAGLGPGLYTVGRWKLRIGEDMVAMAPDGSHFVGAAITMKQTAANLEKRLGFSPEQVEKLLVTNPRQAVGL